MGDQDAGTFYWEKARKLEEENARLLAVIETVRKDAENGARLFIEEPGVFMEGISRQSHDTLAILEAAGL